MIDFLNAAVNENVSLWTEPESTKYKFRNHGQQKQVLVWES